MQFVNVIGKMSESKKKPDPIEWIIKQSNDSLLSLKTSIIKKDLSKQRFDKALSKLHSFQEKFIKGNDKSFWIDSGGYNLFDFTLTPEEVDNYIAFYNTYLEELRDDYDKIFSLDLSFGKKNEWFNTIENVKRFNKTSIEKSIEVLKKYPKLKSKFYFVLNFKNLQLYNIFHELYEKFDSKIGIENRAIGGLVSHRKQTKGSTVISPFIGPAFFLLKDYITKERFNSQFRLHFLGVDLSQDRFMIAFLEKLFNCYLKEYNVSSVLSYDTITHSHQAIFELKSSKIYWFDKKRHQHKILCDRDIFFVSPERLERVYGKDNSKIIYDELQGLNTKKQKVRNVDLFFPLFIHSNINLDNFFVEFIASKRLPKLFFKHNDVYCFNEEVRKFFDGVVPSEEKLNSEHGNHCMEIEMEISVLYDVFTENVVNNIRHSLSKTFEFHQLMVDGKSIGDIQDKMKQFITEMKHEEALK
jgi:hypothetical protein